MHAGSLTERVTVQVAARGVGALGGRTTTWSDVKTVWARVKQDSGRDGEDQGQQRESKTFTVTLRRRGRIAATENRLIWRGTKGAPDRTLDILGAVDDEQKDATVLTCEEGRDGGG